MTKTTIGFDDAEQIYIDEKGCEALAPIVAGTWRNWRSAGVGPPYLKVRGRVLYKRQDVLDFIEAGRVAQR